MTSSATSSPGSRSSATWWSGPSSSATSNGLPRDIAELKAGLADDELWRQEYELEWLEEGAPWLSHELIDAAEHPAAGDPQERRNGACFIGNDIGRRRDLWVAFVIEVLGGVAWTREISELENQSFAAHDRELDRLCELYRPRGVWMDQTGMGEKPVEDAIRRYGASVVNGVILSSPARLDLATILRRRMQDRALKIPAGRRALRADLHSVKRRAGAGEIGTPRLVVDDESGESNSHADRFWAAALACGGAAGGEAEFGYTPVTPAAGGRDDDDHPDEWRDFAPGGARW